jgi:hypothetical protein
VCFCFCLVHLVHMAGLVDCWQRALALVYASFQLTLSLPAMQSTGKDCSTSAGPTICCICLLRAAVLRNLGPHALLGWQAHHLWARVQRAGRHQAPGQRADRRNRPAHNRRQDSASKASGLTADACMRWQGRGGRSAFQLLCGCLHRLGVEERKRASLVAGTSCRAVSAFRQGPGRWDSRHVWPSAGQGACTDVRLQQLD